MISMTEMDSLTTLQSQMVASGGPVVLINKFSVPQRKMDEVLEVWAQDAAFMKRQPGFISTQLHEGIEGSGTLVNIAVWESVEQFRAAFSQPEFQSMMRRYPDGVSISPHLFKKMAVPGICTA